MPLISNGGSLSELLYMLMPSRTIYMQQGFSALRPQATIRPRRLATWHRLISQ
jgi:hypothetical protein